MAVKAQASLEFLLLVGFLLGAFVIFFVVIQTDTSDRIKERAHIEISEVATAVQTEIALASTSTDGYQRTFTTPHTRYLGEYTLTINESILFVTSEEGDYTHSVTVTNVTGQPIRGTNNIKKENGEVTLNG